MSLVKTFAVMAVSGVVTALPAFATDYTWSDGVSSGSWTDPASWGVESGYPSATSDTVTFPAGTFAVTVDEDVSVKHVIFAKDAKVTFSGGHKLQLKTPDSATKVCISGGNEVIVTGAETAFDQIENGNWQYCVSGDGNLIRAENGGTISLKSIRLGVENSTTPNSPPTNLQFVSTGAGSEIYLGAANQYNQSFKAVGLSLVAEKGGKITTGSGLSVKVISKFFSNNQSLVINDGAYEVNTGSYFEMGTDSGTGESLEIKGDNPLLSVDSKTSSKPLVIGSKTSTTVTFKPKSSWSETEARIVSTGDTTIGAKTVIVVDGSDYVSGAGTHVYPLISTAGTMSFGVTAPTIQNFPDGLEVSTELSGKVWQLKVVSTTVAVELPEIQPVGYNGELQVAGVPASDGYKVVRNEGGTDAGEYEVELALVDPQGTKWPDGTSANKILPFVIQKVANAWTTEPKLSKTTWELAQDPADVTVGVPTYGAETMIAYYDDDEACTEMPLTVGKHSLTFKVAESTNVEGLLTTIPYTVTLNSNAWTVRPSLTKTSWVLGEAPAEVNAGSAKHGEVVVSYGSGETGISTALGQHSVTFTVPADEAFAELKLVINYTVTKRPNAWSEPPAVNPARWTADGGVPGVPTTPTATYGEVVVYYDGNAELTEMPLTVGKHTVTYKVAEGGDYQGLTKTVEYEILATSPVVGEPDTNAVTYTWFSGIAQGKWADPINWNANKTPCYGIPSNRYATVSFPASDFVVDLEGRDYGCAAYKYSADSSVRYRNGVVSNSAFQIKSNQLLGMTNGVFIGQKDLSAYLFEQGSGAGGVLELGGNATYSNNVTQWTYNAPYNGTGNEVHAIGMNNRVTGYLHSEAGHFIVRATDGELWVGGNVTTKSKKPETCMELVPENATISIGQLAPSEPNACYKFTFSVPQEGFSAAPIQIRQENGASLNTNVIVNLTFARGASGLIPLVSGVGSVDLAVLAEKAEITPADYAERTTFLLEDGVLKAKVEGVGFMIFVK